MLGYYMEIEPLQLMRIIDTTKSIEKDSHKLWKKKPRYDTIPKKEKKEKKQWDFLIN